MTSPHPMNSEGILESGSILLRAPEPEDIDLMYTWENDTQNWKLSSTLTPFSKFTIEKYISQSHRDIYENKELRLIIVLRDGNRPVGIIDLFDFDPYHQRAGIGILVADPSDRKRGIASEALQLLINYSFSVLGLHQLYCNITAGNLASLKLFKKHGFLIAGEKKEWIRNGNTWINEFFLQLINTNSQKV
ncbi:MAG: GNAT family protein [Bacteroidia bacterium]|nr:GNAT family protein [Bacteroidia bacterium]